METIKKHITFNTDSDIYLNIFITEEYNPIGFYDVFEDDEVVDISYQYILKTVTGITESRLNEVKCYDINNPYKIGKNGVTNIDKNINGDIIKVYYTIDNINYITDLITNVTTYSLPNSKTINFENKLIYKNSKYFGISSVFDNEYDLDIDRSEISVLESHYRLSSVNSINDINDYASGFYFSIFENAPI